MNELNFEEFKKAIVDNIKDYLPAKFEESDVVVKQILKNNDTVLDGLTIPNPDTNVAPTIYLNQFFEEYQNGKDLNDIIGDIADMYGQYPRAYRPYRAGCHNRVSPDIRVRYSENRCRSACHRDAD